MNPQEVFGAWRTENSRTEVSADFTDRVMAGIRSHPETRSRRLTSLLQSLAARPWATAAAVIAGTLLGLVRIAVTLHLILFA